MPRKYNDYDRDKANEVRFSNIMAQEYEPRFDRESGFVVMYLNSRWTIVDLEPVRNITQWKSTVNGVLFKESAGMNKVYRELARLNPPARNFY